MHEDGMRTFGKRDELFLRKILDLQKQQVDLYDCHLQWLGNRRDRQCSILAGTSNDADIVDKPCCSMPEINDDGVFTRPIAVKMPLQRCDEAVHLPKDFDLTGANPADSMKLSTTSAKRRNDLSILFEDDIWEFDMTSWISEPEGHTKLPTGTILLHVILFVQGSLPSSFLKGRSWQRLYRSYKVFVMFSWLCSGIWFVLQGLMSIWAGLFPVEFCFSAIFVIGGPWCTVTAWKLLDERGAYMEFIHQATRRGFDWSSLKPFTYIWSIFTMGILVIFAVFYSLFLLSPHLVYHFELQWNVINTVVSGIPDDVIKIVVWLSLPCMVVSVCVGMCTIWMVTAISELHKYDLLIYGAAVSKVLESSNHDLEPVTVLKKLEMTVTARLRHANRTWVFVCMLFLCLVLFSALICASFLFAADSEWTARVLPATYIAFSCFAVSIILSSLARVSETFDYDVLRALNNPVVLHRAQAYFGQMMLSHLHTLEWGFRFGGTVISSKFVGNIIAGLVLSSVTTISTSMMSKLE